VRSRCCQKSPSRNRRLGRSGGFRSNGSGQKDSADSIRLGTEPLNWHRMQERSRVTDTAIVLGQSAGRWGTIARRKQPQRAKGWMFRGKAEKRRSGSGIGRTRFDFRLVIKKTIIKSLSLS